MRILERGPTSAPAEINETLSTLQESKGFEFLLFQSGRMEAPALTLQKITSLLHLSVQLEKALAQLFGIILHF